MPLAHSVRYERDEGGTGISASCPSTTPLGLVLGPDLPWADEPSPGTLGQSAGEFFPPLSLLMPTFSLDTRPPLGYPAASIAYRRSPTTPTRFRVFAGIRSFGTWLSPVTLSAQDHLTSELLRTLSRVAASKPTSWLSLRSHILYHSAMI